MGERVDLEREKRFVAAHTGSHDRIYRYFRRRTDGAATAEDLCAEVFRIAWEKSGQDAELPVLVIFGIAKNVLRNHDRSVSRSSGLIGALQMERIPGAPEEGSAVRDAIDHLAPKEARRPNVIGSVSQLPGLRQLRSRPAYSSPRV